MINSEDVRQMAADCMKVMPRVQALLNPLLKSEGKSERNGQIRVAMCAVMFGVGAGKAFGVTLENILFVVREIYAHTVTLAPPDVQKH